MQSQKLVSCGITIRSPRSQNHCFLLCRSHYSYRRTSRRSSSSPAFPELARRHNIPLQRQYCSFYRPIHHICNDLSTMKLSFGPIHALEGASLAFLMLIASDRTGTTIAFTIVPSTAREVPRNVVASQPRRIQMKSTTLWAKTDNSYRSNLLVTDAAIMKEAEIHGNKATTETPTPIIKRKSTDPTPVIFSLVEKMTQEPKTAVAAFALALVLMSSPTSASAAMSEGSFPSQHSSPSLSMRPSSSRSYGDGYSRGSSYSRLFHAVYGLGSRAIHSVDGTGLRTGSYSRPQVSPFGIPSLPSLLRINALE
jgi:hypothetical protein